MLSDEEIEQCLNEHESFVDLYINPWVHICCDKLMESPNHWAESIFHGDRGPSSLMNAVGYLRPNRNLFFNAIGKARKFGNCLEIGVADGQNSKRIFHSLNPEKLWLIDPWVTQDNRGADRGKLQREHTQAERAARNRLKPLVDSGRVEIMKAFAKDKADDFPDEFFDFIYIDGDHSYEGCKEDLYAWYPKLKPNGMFAGHDFTNTMRSMKEKKFGVQKAATEFLIDVGRKIDIMTPCVETRYPYMLLPFDWGFIKR